MNNDSKDGIFDSKTLLAIGLVGIVWFGWQSYLGKKYPQKPVEQAQKSDIHSESTGNPQQSTGKPTELSTKSFKISGEGKNRESYPQENLLPFEAASFKASISSLGMGLQNFILKDHNHRDGSPVDFGLIKPGLFALYKLEAGKREIIAFELKKVSSSEYLGTAEVNGFSIERKMSFISEKRAFQHEISIGLGAGKAASELMLEVGILEKESPHQASSIFMPNLEHQEIVFKAGNQLERINLAGQKEGLTKSADAAKMLAISSQYFTSALLDQSDLFPKVQVNAPMDAQKELSGFLEYAIPASQIAGLGANQKLNLRLTSYVGPKNHEQLQSIDSNLGEIINFGWFQSIGAVLLLILKWFQLYLNNWGLSIIALTVLVRMLVLPFNIASYKSMKKMQQVQPLIQSLRERYKDDSQALNREMMTLMKEHRVNPVGGCLPMFLQMPVFFALYQVLGQSVELYRAPFFGWIHDLSLKDPYFILPVLMGLAMWIQQKITPSTMDPAQAKIMQFVPVVFAFFMVSLPSGLTLYMFVSTFFGIVQQQIFMREKRV